MGANLANKQAAYQGAMIACARAGDYGSCRDFFMRMRAAEIPPNNSHYNALLTACAKDALADLAQAVFDQMKDAKLPPRVAEWTILLSCHRNNLQRSKEIFQEM